MYILNLRRLLNEKLTKGQDAVIEVDKEGFAKLLCHCFAQQGPYTPVVLTPWKLEYFSLQGDG